GLGQQRLAAAGRADEQDVGLRQFDVAGLAAVLEALVVVMHCDRKDALRAVLADHIVVERVADVLRRRDAAVLLARDSTLGFFANDVVAQLDAFIADEYRRAGDQLAHLVLGLAAEAAVEGALAVGTAEFGHILVHLPRAGGRGFASGNVAPGVSISIASTLIAPACSSLKGQGCQNATISGPMLSPRVSPALLRSRFRRRS